MLMKSLSIVLMKVMLLHSVIDVIIHYFTFYQCNNKSILLNK